MCVVLRAELNTCSRLKHSLSEQVLVHIYSCLWQFVMKYVDMSRISQCHQPVCSQSMMFSGCCEIEIEIHVASFSILGAFPTAES